MAGIAFLGCGNMIGRLADGYGVVVADTATTRYLIVVNPGNRPPSRGRMASFANIGAGNMGGVLTGGNHIVMTTETVSGHTGVIKRRT